MSLITDALAPGSIHPNGIDILLGTADLVGYEAVPFSISNGRQTLLSLAFMNVPLSELLVGLHRGKHILTEDLGTTESFRMIYTT